jgi:hypothetical protein
VRDLDDWQQRVFGRTEPAPEKPAEIPKGVPTVDITCQLCQFVSPVMEGFEELFYLEHLEEDGKVAHFVRAVSLHKPTV